MGTQSEVTKAKRQLNTILKQVPQERKAVGEKLVEELLFIFEVLQDLKLQIKETGPVSLFKQGKQEFMRESPALKGYNSTIQRYSLLYKQLLDLLPKVVQEENKSPLSDFIKGE